MFLGWCPEWAELKENFDLSTVFIPWMCTVDIYIYSFHFFFFPTLREAMTRVFKDRIESSRLICRRIDRQIMHFTNAYLMYAG